MSATALEHVNRYLGRQLEWQLLARGNSSNLLYQGWLRRPGQHSRQLILRVNAGAGVAFGVDRCREARVLAAVQRYCWAPRVVHNDWQQGWCLMEYAGAPVAAGRLSAGSHEQLLDALREWQNPDATADFPQMDYAGLWQLYREVFAHARRQQALSLNAVEALLETAWRYLQRLPAIPDCLVHHDLHAGNLCFHQGRLVVLDWEYAGTGCAWFDAAALRYQFQVSEAEIAALPAFASVKPQTLDAGLRSAHWLNAALELLWHSVRDLKRRYADLSGLLTRAQQLLDQQP